MSHEELKWGISFLLFSQKEKVCFETFLFWKLNFLGFGLMVHPIWIKLTWKTKVEIYLPTNRKV
jgi:hypothetical protein